MHTTMEKFRYPIGRFECPSEITSKHLTEWVSILEELPERLANLVEPLSEAQLDTPYRPEGWTVRQLIHHIADSHHHSYIRFKWALTEEKPVIKAYDEGRWAALFDSKTAPIKLSLSHLKAVHAKLIYLLKGLSAVEIKRVFVHPDSKSEIPLDQNIGHYAWHSKHHYAHIERLLQREGWV